MPCTYVFYIRLSSSSIDMTQKIKHLHSISCSPLTFLLIQKIKPSRLSWRIRWGQWKLENAHQWYLRLLLVFLRNNNSLFLLAKKSQSKCNACEDKATELCIAWKVMLLLHDLAFLCHFLSPPTLVMSTNKGRRITAFSAFFLWRAQKGWEINSSQQAKERPVEKKTFFKAADNVKKLIHVAKK